MALESLEIANGILMIILVTIAIIVGLTIASKFFQYKQKEFLYVGIAWCFMVCPWYPGALSFIMVLLTGQYLPTETYMIIGNVFIPIAIVLWLAAWTEFLYEQKQKLIVTIFIIYGIIFLIIFFSLLSLDPSLIGNVMGIDVKYGNFIAFYYVTIEIVILLTGYLFVKKSMHSDNPEIRLKSKFLLLAFIFYVIGSTLDTLLTLDWITLALFRGFEIASAFSFYLGFILPSFVKKIFIE